MLDVFIGWDPREAVVADVCRFSILRRTDENNININCIRLDEMRDRGLYHRPHEIRSGRLWDNISEAPMSTEFAISRFLVPFLSQSDWAIFCDCDFLWLDDIQNLIKIADDQYAVMCVKHNHVPLESEKMDAQLQTRYHRKNWSSMVIWNLRHPANKRLRLDDINGLPGRDLHRFCWLKDKEIGAIPIEWNWLEGISDLNIEPKVVHFTRGGPWFDNWENVAFSDLWKSELRAMRETA